MAIDDPAVVGADGAEATLSSYCRWHGKQTQAVPSEGVEDFVGADSGGPRDFMTNDVGYLVPESDDMQVFSKNLAKAVIRAIKEDWKTKMREQCIEVAAPFSNLLKTKKLLADTRKLLG